MPRKKAVNLNPKTIKYCTDQGWLADVVERSNQFIKRDLFGFLDILAIGDDKPIGIQLTSKSNMSSRKKKILSHKNWDMVSKHMYVCIHGWYKEKNKWKVEILWLNRD